MVASLVVIVFVSALYIIFPESISAQSEETTFVTHSGSVVKTTGEILDPLYTSATMEFDPMEYFENLTMDKYQNYLTEKL